MSNLKSILGILSVLAIFTFAASAQNSSPSSETSGSAMNQSSNSSKGSKLSAADKQFMKKAAVGGMAEVELGQLATEKAANDDVKKFGQRMVDDHSKANDQLKQVAANEGVDLPQQLSAKDKALKARLSKLSGESFDKAYMTAMVKDHTKDVADFRRESENGQDPEVRNFAKETLPTLESHLTEAKSVAPQTGSAAPTTTSMK